MKIKIVYEGLRDKNCPKSCNAYNFRESFDVKTREVTEMVEACYCYNSCPLLEKKEG